MDEQMVLMYLGRRDNQIKLNGCRIELNEIESILLSYPGITYCIIVIHQCPLCPQRNQASLCAYIHENINEESLRQYLIDKLPLFMIPTYFIFNCSSQLPKTNSNKIDRHLLIHDENIHKQMKDEMLISFMTDEEKQINALWNKVLLKDSNYFNTKTFSQEGGNSLLVSRLSYLIKEHLSLDIAIHSHMNLKQMIDMLHQSDRIHPNHIYPIIENDLKLSFEQLNTFDCHSRKSKEIHSIFLTGVTGFLGCFLLNELLLKTTMKIIVLIRSKSMNEAKTRLYSNMIEYHLFNDQIEERVEICLCNDLSDENCPLLFNQWEKIDAILHCLSQTNFNLTYQQLRQVNVQFTKFLLEKCFSYGISFYYISTLSIYLFNKIDEKQLRITECDQPELESIIGGYSQTKYVAERLVLESFKKGINGCIFRPGRITGCSRTGYGTKQDLFTLMLKGCYQLGAYPHLKFPFDLTPVDKVSQSIIEIIVNDQFNENHCKPLIIHLINTNTISFDEQFHLLEEYLPLKHPLKCLSFEQWFDQLEKESSHLSNCLLPFVPYFKSSFWKSIQYWPIFEQSNLSNAIIHICPKTLFQLYCQYWKHTQFFY